MSVVWAFVSDDLAAVFSDGRMSLNNSKKSDTEDKTFKLRINNNFSILCGNTGQLYFDYEKISYHFSRALVNTNCKNQYEIAIRISKYFNQYKFFVCDPAYSWYAVVITNNKSILYFSFDFNNYMNRNVCNFNVFTYSGKPIHHCIGSLECKNWINSNLPNIIVDYNALFRFFVDSVKVSSNYPNGDCGGLVHSKTFTPLGLI